MTTLDPLATLEDLQARLPEDAVDNEDRAEALLIDASAAVRAYTGQDFTQATTTIRLPVRNGRIRFPQRPVTAVSAIADMNANAITFEWWGGESIEVIASVIDSWQREPWSFGLTHVDVTYTHGYDEIPADIVAVVCQIAARAWGRSADTSGITQESIAGYSYSVGGAAAAGPFGLLGDERRALDRYRVAIGNFQVSP